MGIPQKVSEACRSHSGKSSPGCSAESNPAPSGIPAQPEFLEHAPHMLNVHLGVGFTMRNGHRLNRNCRVAQKVKQRSSAVRAAVIVKYDR